MTFDIDSASDILDCTYTNRAQRGNIVIKKVTDPVWLPRQSFPFTLSGGPIGSSFNESFNLTWTSKPTPERLRCLAWMGTT